MSATKSSTVFMFASIRVRLIYTLNYFCQTSFLLLTRMRFINILDEHLILGTFRYVWNRYASVAQSVERNHGKVEVSGSIPLGGSRRRA